MKKLVLSVATACLLIAPNSLEATGIPTVDIAAIAQNIMSYMQMLQDYAVQIQQYESMVEQLQQQVKMVEMQQANLRSLGSLRWDNLGSILSKQKNIMQRVDAISYDLGNISDKFERTYKDFDGYEKDLSSASDEAQRTKLYSDRYKQIHQTNQDTLLGSLEKLESSYKDINQEDQLLTTLKSRSENADGNLKVIQATNDLLAFQIDEIRKLRFAVMDQSNAMFNYFAAQNNEKVMARAGMENFKKPDPNNPYKKQKYNPRDFILKAK